MSSSVPPGTDDLNLPYRHLARLLVAECPHTDGPAACSDCLATWMAKQEDQRRLQEPDGVCPLCQKLTSQFAGNPEEWPVFLPAPTVPAGKMTAHHIGCVYDRLYLDGATHAEVPVS